MDDSQAATLATASAARRRPPWLVPGGLLLILAFLTVNAVADGPLVAADRRIRAAVQAQANSATWHWVGHGAHAPAQLLTDLGSNQVAMPILIVCALAAALWRRSLRPLVAAAAGVVLLLATVIPAKILTDRAGPGLPPVPFGHLGVFPSGHTTTAGVCVALGVLLLVPGLPATARQLAVAAMAAVCFLVGAALIWCDYHWFTDVAAGWALTALIVMAALRLAGLRPRDAPGGNSAPPGAVARVAASEPARTERP
jgi:membrane-associated phospholipid phosphatase